MLATYVGLHDIDDVEGFVCATIERSGLRGSISETEREELIAEGICIMFELSGRFEPHREGYATSGRFSGYAAQFLPRRLGDAWHAKNPEHRRITGEDGKRRWHYTSSPLSLGDLLTAGTSRGAISECPAFDETSLRPREHWAPVTA